MRFLCNNTTLGFFIASIIIIAAAVAAAALATKETAAPEQRRQPAARFVVMIVFEHPSSLAAASKKKKKKRRSGVIAPPSSRGGARGIKTDRLNILTKRLIEDYAQFKGVPIRKCASDSCILAAAKGLYNATPAASGSKPSFEKVYRAAVEELVRDRCVYLTNPYLG